MNRPVPFVFFFARLLVGDSSRQESPWELSGWKGPRKSSAEGVRRTFPPEAASDVFCQVKWPRNRQRKVNCPENRQIEAMNFTIERANRNRFSGNRQATADYSCNWTSKEKLISLTTKRAKRISDTCKRFSYFFVPYFELLHKKQHI